MSNSSVETLDVADPGHVVHFQEVQRLRQWWLVLPIGSAALVMWIALIAALTTSNSSTLGTIPINLIWIFWASFGVVLPLFFAIASLRVRVTDDAIRVSWVPIYRTAISLDDIEQAFPRTYAPITEYLGWGVRYTPSHGWALTTSGNEGVQLVLRSGKRVLIGSRQPQRLAAAIMSAKGTANL